MPDPSDPSNAHPVNRVADSFGSDSGEDAPADLVPELAPISSPEMDSLAERWEWESSYRLWYELARADVDSGKDPDEIRSYFLDIAENSGGTAEAVREALEDALAGRPPKCKFPLEP